MARLGLGGGIALAVIAVLLTLANASALPVVMDVRALLLAVSVAAGLLLAWSRRGARRQLTRTLVLVASAAMTIVAGATAWDLFVAYRVEQVTFGSEGISLRGSLYLPRGEGPFPAVVLVHGSGEQPRDEYRYYARLYAKHGVAALAYDKRGAGESGGDFTSATYADFAADAAAAVRMLRDRPDIRTDAVGLWGLSEGEWVAPLAARLTQPAFVVLVSPSAMTPAEQVRYETGASVRRAGFSDAQAREAEALYRQLSEFQRSGTGRDALNRRLAAASREPWFEAAENLEPSVPEYERVLALPWFSAWRARMDFDALPIMAELRCAVLAQAGGSDPQNDGAAALARLREALERGGNIAFTGIVYPDANHGIIEWVLPFGLPPPRFAPGYLRAQVGWVIEQVNNR